MPIDTTYPTKPTTVPVHIVDCIVTNGTLLSTVDCNVLVVDVASTSNPVHPANQGENLNRIESN